MGGRWPPNLLLTHSVYCADECHTSCPVRVLDEQSGNRKTGALKPYKMNNGSKIYGGGNGVQFGGENVRDVNREASEGGASRFFPTFSYTEEDFYGLGVR